MSRARAYRRGTIAGLSLGELFILLSFVLTVAVLLLSEEAKHEVGGRIGPLDEPGTVAPDPEQVERLSEDLQNATSELERLKAGYGGLAEELANERLRRLQAETDADETLRAGEAALAEEIARHGETKAALAEAEDENATLAAVAEEEKRKALAAAEEEKERALAQAEREKDALRQAAAESEAGQKEAEAQAAAAEAEAAESAAKQEEAEARAAQAQAEAQAAKEAADREGRRVAESTDAFENEKAVVAEYVAQLKEDAEKAEQAAAQARERAQAARQDVEKEAAGRRTAEKALEEKNTQIAILERELTKLRKGAGPAQEKGVDPPCWYTRVAKRGGGTREKPLYAVNIAIHDGHVVIGKRSVTGLPDGTETGSYAREYTRLGLGRLPYGRRLNDAEVRRALAPVHEAGENGKVRSYPCKFYAQVWDRTSPGAKNRWKRGLTLVQQFVNTYVVQEDPWPG